MPFFTDANGPQDEDGVAVVLSWRTLANLKEMLGGIPFRDAEPIYRALTDLSSAQWISGRRAAVQTALEKHREREALAALPIPDSPLN